MFKAFVAILNGLIIVFFIYSKIHLLQLPTSQHEKVKQTLSHCLFPENRDVKTKTKI
jgi:hypothetical protein